MMSSEHNRFLYYMPEIYVSALLDFNSFSEPPIHIQSFTSLPRGGGHHHNT